MQSTFNMTAQETEDELKRRDVLSQLTVGYCRFCGEGHSLLGGLCYDCRPYADRGMSIAQVKAELPLVLVRYAKQQWWARVSGTFLSIAQVVPYKRTERGRVRTIMGPIFHFSWKDVMTAVNSESALDCENIATYPR